MSPVAFSLCTSQPGRYIFHEILQHKCLPRQQQRQVVRRAKELLDKWVQRLNEMGWIFFYLENLILLGWILNGELALCLFCLIRHICTLLSMLLASVVKSFSVPNALSACSGQSLSRSPCSPPPHCLPHCLSLITCNSLVGWGPPLGGDMCTSQYKPLNTRPTLQASSTCVLTFWAAVFLAYCPQTGSKEGREARCPEASNAVQTVNPEYAHAVSS